MRKFFQNKRPVHLQQTGGFALIVVLCLLILLTILAVGMLSLSTISLRLSTRAMDMATARANARLALSLAIGELQKQTGSDTRVTARADILDEANPPVAGVWRSWEGTDHSATGTFTGRPVSPGADYKNVKRGRFLTWLVSGDPGTLENSATPPNVTPGTGKVALVGEGSVGSGSERLRLQVYLRPSGVTGSRSRGAYGWWVAGENQKARLPQPYQPVNDTGSGWAMEAKSHSVADPEVFGMKSLLSDPSPAANAITLRQSDIIAEPQGGRKASEAFFHDLSTHSVGLLTNTATGGWRKDLSLITERWSDVGTLPLFQVLPGQDLIYNRPTSGSPTPSRSMFYPWGAYRNGGAPIELHGPVTSWENLVDYALLYKRMPASGTSGRTTLAPYSVDITGDRFNFLHRVRVFPVIARIQWVFSHSAGPAPAPGPGQPPNPPGSLQPRLLVTPVVTIWNPYNVEIAMTGGNVPLLFNLRAPLPIALRYNINGIPNQRFNGMFTGGSNTPALADSDSLIYQISSPFTLKPGETRIFSPAANDVRSADSIANRGPEGVSNAGPTLPLSVGYRSSGGHFFALKDDSGRKIVAPSTATMQADARFDTAFNDGSSGVGVYFDFWSVGSARARHLAYRMNVKPEVANAVYRPLNGLARSDPLSGLVGNPTPFLTTVFGARMASKTYLASKGFVQSSPLVNYTELGGKDEVVPSIQYNYPGTDHPVNSPFDYSFEPVAGAGDSLLPNASDATGRGYIVTGFNSADGLARCVIDELPTRPLQSLAELQHWDLRRDNPVPPFAFNLIGNSDATPIIPRNAVFNAAESSAKGAANLQYDDSYCANHLLFDDWFVSSIAPKPGAFGSPSGSETLRKTFMDFASGAEPLSNRAYRLNPTDSLASLTASGADKLFTDHVNARDSWRNVASRLEVIGMFNVNSTSVVAWRSLLRHAREQKVPFLKESGTSWGVDLSNESDHPFSRFSVAGDSESKSQGASGSFPESAEFAGYRVMDSAVVDALAREVVNQVRLRGPFLSLSEFVNRQLSSGNLALAGAVQSALDEISRSTQTNPYKGITDVINRPSRALDATYRFPEAAVGQAAYGLPGWTRQADVLRPIAPILSARDDTFTIRAYGSAIDSSGSVTASVTCEAVVRRTREYVDPTDAANLTTLPSLQVNRTFGRRYEVVSFRWLAPTEI